ncbi:MAG TPA: cysteine--1-D-myo-inosityl 2-amino-2-deoxy-alpha-D-glucopyranoside ligase [Mycobacteriales bacterium]|nr:cysteine--1-D-myo-inosityl 2-amino-2-deoxy-alpha-D-glucopyranoside ligase [Mycobacteriales bacterium]
MRSWDSPPVPKLDVLGVAASDVPVEIHDTASAALKRIGEGKQSISLYVCGITPYDATHLGHAATYLLFDELQRVCRDAGIDVRYVQNVTDVDDPLLERAAQSGEDWTALADREIDLFRADMSALRILAPAEYVGAVEAIPDIAASIARLRDKGVAYDVDGDIYFSAGAAPDLGDLSHLPVDAMISLFGERGGDPERPGKKDPLDWLLWRAERPGEPSWSTMLGAGRPGWHIECTTIAMKHLGESIDIQGGGDDLVFPHHEMGGAEATVLSGRAPFAAASLHQAMVGYDGEKMSKSRGNLVLVSKLRESGVDPMAIRLALLNHHHSTAWEWNDEELDTATERLARWRSAFTRETAAPAEPLIDVVRRALRSGLDTPKALAAVDNWVKTEGEDATAPEKARAAADALLGVI